MASASGDTIATSGSNPVGSSNQATAGSRESSEFEFVGNNGGNGTNNPAPPATLHKDKSEPNPQLQPTNTKPNTATQPMTSSRTSSIITPTQNNVLEGSSTAPGTSEDDDAAFPGLFGWVKGTGGGLFSKVAEKTKSSMETVITTLDPQIRNRYDEMSRVTSNLVREFENTIHDWTPNQMKEYIRSGGEVTVVVASDKEVKVQPVREAFQKVLGRATIFGVAAKTSSTIADQPVGFAAGRQAAQERIQNIRGSSGRVPSNEIVDEENVVVAIENFLLEVGDDAWVDIGCLILSDVSRGIHLTGYTQPTSVESRFVDALKAATPETYPKRWSGYAQTIGGVIEKESGVPRREWHEVFGGISRKDILLMAATSLAHSYNKALLANVEEI